MKQRLAVLRRVLGNDGLRRLAPAFLGFGAAEYGVWVAVLVFAYGHGGTTMSAAVAVLQLLPAAVVAPLGATLADRRGGAWALRVSYLLQALTVGVSAVAMLVRAPPAVVYAGAVLAASAVTLTRPAQGALLPALVRTPDELTAANVVWGWVESVSLMIGPALAGILITIDGSGLALAVFACGVLGSAMLVAPLRAPAQPDPTEVAEQLVDAPLEVLRMLRRSPGLSAVFAVIAAQHVAEGAMDVLEVVLAIKVLSLGPGGAGYLAASFGAGAVAGGFVAITLVGRQRLVGVLLAAALAWGGAFIGIGLWPAVGVAFAFLAGAGVGRTVLEVTSRTTLHRVVAPQLHGRVFGVLWDRDAGTRGGLAVGVRGHRCGRSAGCPVRARRDAAARYGGVLRRRPGARARCARPGAPAGAAAWLLIVQHARRAGERGSCARWSASTSVPARGSFARVSAASASSCWRVESSLSRSTAPRQGGCGPAMGSARSPCWATASARQPCRL
jgi:MFS family permease